MTASPSNIPDCLGPRPTVTTPSWRPPAGCWDTQFHVLGPQSRFPYPPQRHYTPPDAPLDAWRRMADVLGIDHGFVIHANTQGPGNEIYLEAVAQAPQDLVAVVRLGPDATRAEVEAMHRRGARGMRFGFNPQHTTAGFDADAVRRAIDLSRDLGWFVQLHFDGAQLPQLADWIAAQDVPIVIDHLGRIDATQGLDVAPQRALLKLAECPHVWVKVSGFDRVCPPGASYEAVAPLVQRLGDTALDRLVWGSDWPHTGWFHPERMPDDGALFQAFVDCVPREADRIRILKTNPLRLLARNT